ncbi:hypothetical protein [Cupriavidus necator]
MRRKFALAMVPVGKAKVGGVPIGDAGCDGAVSCRIGGDCAMGAVPYASPVLAI